MSETLTHNKTELYHIPSHHHRTTEQASKQTSSFTHSLSIFFFSSSSFYISSINPSRVDPPAMSHKPNAIILGQFTPIYLPCPAPPSSHTISSRWPQHLFSRTRKSVSTCKRRSPRLRQSPISISHPYHSLIAQSRTCALLINIL